MNAFVGKFEKAVTDEDGNVIVSFTASGDDRRDARKCAAAARELHGNGKELLRISISADKKQRSLTANAYFHLLIHKIAVKMNLGEENVKRRLVVDYGAVMTDDDGVKVGIKLPSSVDVAAIYPYAKWFGERIDNGKTFDCYIIYKQTHTLDAAEMARLIKGAVYEAEELGIETKTPDELAKMINLMEQSPKNTGQKTDETYGEIN